MECRICKNSINNPNFKIKEMYFGLKDEFKYFECSNCGCLQIFKIPSEINKYYSNDFYYSFQKEISLNPLRKYLRKKVNLYTFFNNDSLGRLLYKNFKYPYLKLIAKTKININSHVLDVGCGNGELLYLLREVGFKNLMGIDPYLPKEIIKKNMKIFKKNIFDISDNSKYELILFNHSFEHMHNHQEVLNKVNNLLLTSGICMISMPLKTDTIWELYNTNWVQIDAPRHFIIHSMNSFSSLLKESGLHIENVIFDSNEFQFWGSEQLKRNIPLISENSFLINPKKSIFTKEDIINYRKKAEELNKRNSGDQATFYLKKDV